MEKSVVKKSIGNAINSTKVLSGAAVAGMGSGIFLLHDTKSSFYSLPSLAVGIVSSSRIGELKGFARAAALFEKGAGIDEDAEKILKRLDRVEKFGIVPSLGSLVLGITWMRYFKDTTDTIISGGMLLMSASMYAVRSYTSTFVSSVKQIDRGIKDRIAALRENAKWN
ncbi:MAG: hypothetical protein KGH69_04340 [Candidatus Micrarchaeota archaeon]|nr:hypothetical protein [Candidatus Micrarchaeota archaeon]